MNPYIKTEYKEIDTSIFNKYWEGMDLKKGIIVECRLFNGDQLFIDRAEFRHSEHSRITKEQAIEAVEVQQWTRMVRKIKQYYGN